MPRESSSSSRERELCLIWSVRRLQQSETAEDRRHANESAQNHRGYASDAAANIVKKVTSRHTASADETKYSTGSSSSLSEDTDEDDTTIKTSNTVSSPSRPSTSSQNSSSLFSMLSESFSSVMNGLKTEEIHLDHQDTWDMQEKPRIPSSLFSLLHGGGGAYVEAGSRKNVKQRSSSWPLTKSQISAVANTSLSENLCIIDKRKNDGRHKWERQEKVRIPSSLVETRAGAGIEASSGREQHSAIHQRPSEPKRTSHEHTSIFDRSGVVLPPSERLMKIREELQKNRQKGQHQQQHHHQLQQKKKSSSRRALGGAKKHPQPKESNSTIENMAVILANNSTKQAPTKGPGNVMIENMALLLANEQDKTFSKGHRSSMYAVAAS